MIVAYKKDMPMIDLKIALKHLYTLPFIFGKFLPICTKNSELNPKSYHSLLDAALSAKSALIGSSDQFTPGYFPNSDVVFFLNGICTNLKVWAVNANEIEHFFNFQVSSLYNPTHGFFKDLVECVFNKSVTIRDKETDLLYTTLKDTLEVKEKVIVIAHSQGGIIIAQLIQRLLMEGNINLHKLELYTFASAANDMPVGDYYAEHFANVDDFVSRIGVLEYHNDYYGKIFKRNSAGHLLNVHYLQPLAKGEFCVGRSRLSTYLKYKHRAFIQKTEI